MSLKSKYRVEEKAREFDRWVSEAHRARFRNTRPSARAKGVTMLEAKRETGLSRIADKYKKIVRDTRRRPRRDRR